MYNNPCPTPQMLWRTLWAGCWQNAFLLNVDSMPSHQDISHSLSIPGHNQDSHDDHLYGGADQASEDRRGGPPANHKSSFVISYVISYQDVHDFHKGAPLIRHQQTDGVVLGESSCKSIPADDSLLRTAGSTGAILTANKFDSDDDHDDDGNDDHDHDYHYQYP